MLLRLRRIALLAILAIVFLLGFFIGRRSVTRGARFKQEQWAIDVAADYLQKQGTYKLVAAQLRLVPFSRSRLRRAFSER